MTELKPGEIIMQLNVLLVREDEERAAVATWSRRPPAVQAAAEAIAEAIIETLAYAGDPVVVPAAYLPGWERV